MALLDSFLHYLRGAPPKSASIAKERLQLILAHENGGRRGAPDYLPALRRIYEKYPELVSARAVEILIAAHVERRQLLDDAMALLYAAASPDADLLAVAAVVDSPPAVATIASATSRAARA